MARIILNQSNIQITNIIRSIGYKEIYDRFSNQTSYARRLGLQDYPRFHINLTETNDAGYVLNLHYDVVRPRHKQYSSASEDEGEVINQEKDRICQILKIQS